MIPLFDLSELSNYRSRDLLPLQCRHCKQTFNKSKHYIQAALKPGDKPKSTLDYCSEACRGVATRRGQDVACKLCQNVFYRQACHMSSNNFCSSSCSALYNNTRKKTGTRRSKLEVWMQEQLTNRYPDLTIHYNQKDAINSELDIYIPSLSLAIELNGIFHYEPIYGKEKLSSIQNNDSRKFQACLEHGIELCIIDTSAFSYFKPSAAQKFFDIIVNLLATKGVSSKAT
jgi:hypothetical protein